MDPIQISPDHPAVKLAKERDHLAKMVAEARDGDTSKIEGAAELLRSLEREYQAVDAEFRLRIEDTASARPAGAPLAKGQSLTAALGSRPDDVSLGAVLKGLVLGNWKGTRPEVRALMTSGTSAAVPDAISLGIIDAARAQSAIFAAGASILPLDSGPSAKVARTVSTPEVQWLPEAEDREIALGSWEFDAANLDAHSAWLRTRLSIELVEDGIGVDAAIVRAFSAQLAEAFDMGALVGTGVDQPTGLAIMGSEEDRIHEVAAVGAISSYAPFIHGAGLVRASHLTPTAVILPPSTWTTLNTLVDSNLNPLLRPAAYTDMAELVSSHLANVPLAAAGTGVAIVGAFENLVIGLRTGLVIEVSREAGDAFKSGFVEVRAYSRFDTMLLRPEAFAVLKGVTLEA